VVSDLKQPKPNVSAQTDVAFVYDGAVLPFVWVISSVHPRFPSVFVDVCTLSQTIYSMPITLSFLLMLVAQMSSSMLRLSCT